MYRKWSDIEPPERQAMRRAILDGRDPLAIVEEYGLDPQKVESIKRRLREVSEGSLPVLPSLSFEQRWKMLCQFIGRDPKRPIPQIKRGKTLNRRKVVVLCDLHGYPDEFVVGSAMAERPALMILNGDVFDAFAFSHFEEFQASPISEELARVRAFLELMVANGIPVKMNSGNHDDRAAKYFARHIATEFMPLVKYNLLELVSEGMKDVTVVKNLYDFTTGAGRQIKGVYVNNWIVHEGDALIGHAETARKGEARSADGFADWVNLWRLPLTWKDPSLIIQGHVHRANVAYHAGGSQVRVEGGFAGDLSKLQYAHNFGVTCYSPAVSGYTVFEQDLKDGLWRTDRTSVRFVLC